MGYLITWPDMRIDTDHGIYYQNLKIMMAATKAGTLFHCIMILVHAYPLLIRCLKSTDDSGSIRRLPSSLL